MASTLSILRLWALAAGANLARPRGDRLDTLALSDDVPRAKETLDRWWNLSGPEDAVSTIDWLRTEGHTVRIQALLRHLHSLPAHQVEQFITNDDRWPQHQKRYAWDHRSEFRDGRLEAFDMVRMLFIARATYTAGWLPKRVAWDTVFEAAGRLQEAYDSWAEMSNNYLLGRRYWAGGDPKVQLLFDKHAKWLTTNPESPWQQLPWGLTLKTFFWDCG
jgi:hypothetical protein